MNIVLGWSVAGVIVGLFIHVISRKRYPLVVDLVAGVIGGLVGGIIFVLGGAINAQNFDILSTGSAATGAVVAVGLLRLRALRRRSAPEPHA